MRLVRSNPLVETWNLNELRLIGNSSRDQRVLRNEVPLIESSYSFVIEHFQIRVTSPSSGGPRLQRLNQE